MSVTSIVADEDTSKIPDVSIVEASAELLYGLCHQRFILTRAGLQAMVSTHIAPAPCAARKRVPPQVDKYEAGVFGSCPRVYCNGCNVVPCGRSDLPGMDTVKLFCPNCNDIYTPPSSRFQGVDGAFRARPHTRRTAKLSSRRVLWNDVRTPLLPELPGARTRALLETHVAFLHVPALICELFLQPAGVCEPEPVRRAEARGREGVHPQDLRVPCQREGEERPPNAVDEASS